MAYVMYFPFHFHTMLSNGITNIDSITSYKDYIKVAQECGMTAMAFSEHGSIFEWVHKKKAVEAAGMKYVHAIEAYLTEDDDNKQHLYSAVNLLATSSVSIKSAKVRVYFYKYEISEDGKCLAYVVDGPNAGKTVWIDPETIRDEGYKKTRDNYHCVLIAKNYEGVKELNRLISKSFCRSDYHYYYVPRISFDELFNTSDNIIITSACLGGVIHNGTTSVKERFLSFFARNKHRCYFEIQHHNCQEQIEYNQLLFELSKNLGVPLIVGTDTHALNEDHMTGRAILQKSKDVKFENEDSWDLTFKTPKQLVDAYKKQNSLPMEVVYQAMENSLRLADSIEEFELNYDAKYPKLYEDSDSVFKQKINAGVIWRGINKKPNYKEYVDRIHYEYETYKHNDAIDFMLLEEDYKSEMRRRGIRFGYSRGSVSGSVIAYLLGITEIDSVKYNLNFERFMNTERVSLADIDTDWLSEDRDTVKDYLYQKPGLYCCDIVTFNTIALKGAIKDVCRALYKDSEKNYLNYAEEIIANAEVDEEAARRQYKEVFRYVDLVNGVVVSVGNHPSACVVSPYPVEDEFGTFTTSSDDRPISQINMKEIDSLNFVKLDILGLDNIGLIYKTCDAAGIPFLTPDNTPPDDINVWNSIREDTTMIFQWESESATAYLKQLLSDETVSKIKEKNPDFSYMNLLSIGNGAIRPAGESYRKSLAQGEYRDNGNKELNDFLAPTLGYLVYQEEIIEFLHKFCGFTMGEADIVRRHFSKKTGTEKDIPIIEHGGFMSEDSKHYIKGFIQTMYDDYGVNEKDAKKIIGSFLKVIIDASDYLFSKNHADPYSWIGYICGYLRYYYPLEFITSALNIFEGKEEKSTAIINYAKKNGIKISQIKFRHSIAKYSFDKDTNQIFKGISSIKYMNSNVADEMYALRGREYKSFVGLLRDLEEETSIDSRQLRILIELDFFSEFGNSNNLLKIAELFDQLYGRKQISKEKIESLGISIELAKQYATKETEKMLVGVNVIGLLIEVAETIKEPDRSLREKISSQIEYLGYIDIVDEKYRGVLAVTEVDTKYSPKLELYSLRKGTMLSAKISKTIFKKNTLSPGDVILVQGQKMKNKVKRTADGQFEDIPGEKELWLTKYKKLDKI